MKRGKRIEMPLAVETFDMENYNKANSKQRRAQRAPLEIDGE
jgi:hypothetical protein